MTSSTILVGQAAPPKVEEDGTHRGQDPPEATRVIPRRLIFTYKHDLLVERHPLVLYHNVLNTIKIYSEYWNSNSTEVVFLNNSACVRVIEQAKPKLAQLFEKESRGPIKGDICRTAELYLRGGYYFDVDMKVLTPYDAEEASVDPKSQITTTALLSKNSSLPNVGISLATAYDESRKRFFQSFLTSAPTSSILNRSMELMIGYYETTWKQGMTRSERFDFKLGPETLMQAYKDCHSRMSTQLCPDSISERVHVLDEVFHKKDGQPYPDVERQQGNGCCCNYLVHDANRRIAHFYSRVRGAGGFCT